MGLRQQVGAGGRVAHCRPGLVRSALQTSRYATAAAQACCPPGRAPTRHSINPPLQVRALRQELEGREKALDLARRTVERLSADKGQLETAAAGALARGRLPLGLLLAVLLLSSQALTWGG